MSVRSYRIPSVRSADIAVRPTSLLIGSNTVSKINSIAQPSSFPNRAVGTIHTSMPTWMRLSKVVQAIYAAVIARFWVSVAVGLVPLLAILFVQMYRSNHLLYAGVDGLLFLSFFKNALAHSTALLSSDISYLQGMGTHQWPVGVWISPGWYVCRLSTTFAAILASYLICAASYYFAICYLGRSLRIGVIPTVLAAQAACFLSFPPLVGVSRVHMLFALNPGIAYIVAIGLVALGMFIRIGRGATRSRLLLAGLLPFVVIYAVLCESQWTTVVGIGLALFGVAPFLIERTKRSLVWRVAALIYFVAVLAALSMPQYLYELLKYTARMRFRIEIVGEIQDYQFAFLPFQHKAVAYLFIVLLFGVLMALRSTRRSIRVFAGVCLLHMAGMIAMSIVYLYGDVNWTYPLPVYFELPAIPIYVLIAAAGYRELSLWVQSRRRVSLGRRSVMLQRTLAIASLMIVPVLSMGFMRKVPLQPRNLGDEWIAPVSDFPAVEAVAKRIAWQPGETYQGSVTTVFESEEQPIAHELHSHLWLAKVPTLEEYSVLVSPQYYYMVSRGLGKDADGVSGRNRVVITEPRVGLLRAMGVRYVLTSRTYDTPQFPMKLCEEFTDNQKKTIRLYELESPNLGTYSPTRVKTVNTAPEAMAELLSPDTDLQRDIMLFEPLEGDLAPVTESSMQFVDGGIRVRAKSNGRSLVLLPLQYSHALVTLPANESVRLMRANVAQTALLFEGEVDTLIRLRFSIGQVAGRAKDITDSATLGIIEDGSRKLDVAEEAKFHPHQRFKLLHR
jgi:hypothetical protein